MSNNIKTTAFRKQPVCHWMVERIWASFLPFLSFSILVANKPVTLPGSLSQNQVHLFSDLWLEMLLRSGCLFHDP